MAVKSAPPQRAQVRSGCIDEGLRGVAFGPANLIDVDGLVPAIFGFQQSLDRLQLGGARGPSVTIEPRGNELREFFRTDPRVVEHGTALRHVILAVVCIGQAL